MFEPIPRREALRRIALVLGGTVSAPVISGVLGGCRVERQGQGAAAYAFQALDEDQQRTLAALVDRIIPPTDTPGAAEAGVPQFIDKMLAEWYAPADRDAFLAGLSDVGRRAQAEAGAAFAELDEEAQAAFVAALDARTYAPAAAGGPEVDGDVAAAGREGTYQAQEQQEEEVAGTQGELGEAMSERDRAGEGEQDRPAAGAAGDRAGSGETGGDPNARPPEPEVRVNPDAPPFFRQLKELTLAGYYTSEIGATQELQWTPAPGRYDADVPFSEIGRAWA